MPARDAWRQIKGFQDPAQTRGNGACKDFRQLFVLCLRNSFPEPRILARGRGRRLLVHANIKGLSSATVWRTDNGVSDEDVVDQGIRIANVCELGW